MRLLVKSRIHFHKLLNRNKTLWVKNNTLVIEFPHSCVYCSSPTQPISSDQGWTFSCVRKSFGCRCCVEDRSFLGGFVSLIKRTKFSLGVFSWFNVCKDLSATSPVIREECFLQEEEEGKKKKEESSTSEAVSFLITMELERCGHWDECLHMACRQKSTGVESKWLQDQFEVEKEASNYSPLLFFLPQIMSCHWCSSVSHLVLQGFEMTFAGKQSASLILWLSSDVDVGIWADLPPHK